jgi:ATP-binding cassette, subfamily F, member 3
MINLSHVTLRRGPRALIEDASLTIYGGWRVGVIGRNGTGKSSLFAALLGEFATDKGEISLQKGLAIATVAETPALPDLAIEFALDGDVELRRLERELVVAEDAHDAHRISDIHERLNTIGGYAARARAARLLHGLGFSSAAQVQPVASFSGGWRMRLNLARALMCRSDLLLLDEPTNHLDLDAVIWLQAWLVDYPGTLLVISHDREFLDAVTTHTLHLENARATLYTGNYSQFERQRAEQLALQSAAYAKQQRQVAHLQSFINRFKAKASKATQAQSRIKQLERMQLVAPAHFDSEFTFELPEPERLPSPLIRFDNVSAGYRASPSPQPSPQRGEGDSLSSPPTSSEYSSVPPSSMGADGSYRPSPSMGAGHSSIPSPLMGEGKGGGDKAQRVILSGIKLLIAPGDRIGLLGPNGAGKSTLVRTLAGELPALSGDATRSPHLRVGYFAQHQLEQLDPKASPLLHLKRLDQSLGGRAGELELRNFLGGFNFRGDRVFEAVAPFSGGEKARLCLAMVVYQKPNLLLLDEPTNHLDLDMRHALETALTSFAGAVVLVSHDRHLLSTTSETLLRVSDGQCLPFDGDLDDYARWLTSRDSSSPLPLGGEGKGEGVTRLSAKDRRKAGADARALRTAAKKLDEKLNRLNAELKALDEQLANPALYSRAERTEISKLQRSHAQLRDEIGRTEEEWLKIEDQIEQSGAG